MAEKTRYSDAELEEFRAIIMEKLEFVLEQCLGKQIEKRLLAQRGY